MHISSLRITRRLKLSAYFLGAVLGGVFLFLALGSHESVSIWEGRFYDHVWLPFWGYVYYWGAPWSQIGCFAFGVMMLLLWASWVLQMGLLELPGFVCAWVYLDYVQPSGHELIWLRKNMAALAAHINLGTRPTRPENRSVILKVAELLERRGHERLRSSQAGGNKDAANEFHRKLETRLRFLAEFQCADSPSIDGLIASARWYLVTGSEQSWQHLQSCVQGENNSPLHSVVDLLTRFSHTQDNAFLRAAEAFIRPDLQRVWELIQNLAAAQQGPSADFLFHDFQQFSSTSPLKLSRRFGDVLELWMFAAGDLLQQDELERLADVALKLSHDPLQNHLEFLRSAPGSFDLTTVENFLQESELRRPEAIRHLCGIAHAARSVVSASPLADYSQSQALRHFYSRYDLEWMKAANSQS
jgi:hypothetical protein